MPVPITTQASTRFTTGFTTGFTTTFTMRFHGMKRRLPAARRRDTVPLNKAAMEGTYNPRHVATLVAPLRSRRPEDAPCTDGAGGCANRPPGSTHAPKPRPPRPAASVRRGGCYTAPRVEYRSISNDRILAIVNDMVMFYYRDRNTDGRLKVATLPALEFIRRFLLHVLPNGLGRVRHYGFLFARNKKRRRRRPSNLLGHQLMLPKPRQSPDPFHPGTPRADPASIGLRNHLFGTFQGPLTSPHIVVSPLPASPTSPQSTAARTGRPSPLPPPPVPCDIIPMWTF